MCFSAGASFTGSAVLTAIGVASVRKVSNPATYKLLKIFSDHNPREKRFQE